jgi:excisionase family DNA binding protein
MEKSIIEILTFKEAVEFLKISDSFLYKLTHKKVISHSKPSGKLIYFKKQDLINWMLSNVQLSTNEVENQIINNLNHK